MTTDNENARNQARAQFESIKEMVAALNVDWDRLEDLREAKAELEANPELDEWSTENEEDLQELLNEAGDCKDKEDAEQRIQEDALSVQVRSDWHDPGGDSEATEFQILLCTGGPAVKIEGSLSQYGEPESAEIYFQDWFTKWEPLMLNLEEQEIVLEYCRCFYFGE